MLIVRRAWSEGKQSSEWILWLVSFNEFDSKKIRSMTKLELFSLSEYQVGTYWIGENKARSKESAISTRLSLWEE